jgi:hypothetical protein
MRAIIHAGARSVHRGILPSLRADLTKACGACAFRVAAPLELCPSCGTTLTSIAGALASRPKVRPLRDTLLYAPLVLVYAFAAVTSVVLTADTPPAEEGAMRVGMWVFAVLAGFLAGLVIGGLAWSPWALVVWLASLRAADEPVWLRPTLEAAPSRVKRLRAWVEKRKWLLGATAFAVLLAVELVAELLSEHPFASATSSGGVFPMLALAIGGQLVALVMLGIPFGVVRVMTAQLPPEMANVVTYHAHRRAARGPAKLGRRLRDLLVSERAQVVGPAHRQAGTIVAPIAGTACLAFRLVGRAGSVVIDDAESVPFLVHCGDGEVAVRGDAVVALLPARIAPVRDGAALERVRDLLSARGIPMEPGTVVELAESCLLEGEQVRVHGAAKSERAEGAGYRDTGARRVLEGTSARPVLIERA